MTELKTNPNKQVENDVGNEIIKIKFSWAANFKFLLQNYILSLPNSNECPTNIYLSLNNLNCPNILLPMKAHFKITNSDSDVEEFMRYCFYYGTSGTSSELSNTITIKTSEVDITFDYYIASTYFYLKIKLSHLNLILLSILKAIIRQQITYKGEKILTCDLKYYIGYRNSINPYTLHFSKYITSCLPYEIFNKSLIFEQEYKKEELELIKKVNLFHNYKNIATINLSFITSNFRESFNMTFLDNKED